VHVRRLQLVNFRGYRRLDLDLGAGRLLFLGDNAQGKSNLLEAVDLLATGRSARARNDSELIAWGSEDIQPFARLQTAVERREGPIQLEMLVVGAGPPPAPSRAGKRYKVNGIPRRGADFVGQLRAVLFTADDLEIVSGAPAVRRGYLDSCLSQLDRAYNAALQRYGRLLQQRNATLRRMREGLAGPEELALWDDSFSREGATIIAGRQNAVARLAELAGDAYTELSGGQERLELAYEPQLGDQWRGLIPPEASAATVQPLFAAALAAQRRRETAAGISLVGPHRDDLAIELNGVSAASFGSRAQIRTIALALRLAEARLLIGESGDPPVLLLDDIVSELDESRRRSVLAGVSGFDQVWFTATTGAWLPADFIESCRVFEVSGGAVYPNGP
jgi:DNA replication and repair protein RecF